MNQNQSNPGQRPGNGQGEVNSVTENVKSRTIWLRLFFMLVVLFLYSVSRVVVGAVVVVQFFWVLFTGRANSHLLQFGQSLATYTYQIVCYLTFTSEQRPFPFDADWPTSAPGQ